MSVVTRAIENRTQLERARMIAYAAATLDSEKNAFPDDARKVAALCVNDLHHLAEMLAGNLADQIYR